MAAVHYPHPRIAREGWWIIAISLVLALGVSVFPGGLWSLPFWLFFVFCLQFFRDPPRIAPDGEKMVLSPADGRIVAIGKAEDPWLNREALKISVFMNVFNVHANRSPVAAVVVARWYHPGSFLNAALDKASLENERNALQLRTAEGQDITCVQIAGLVARRILCHVDAGAVLTPGMRYGFIRFGSRVDIYLPLQATVRVALGDKVKATSSLLAHLP